MKLPPQQEKILVAMAPITGFSDYKEIAEKSGVPIESVRTQVGRLGKIDLMIKEDKSSKWQITERGIEESQKINQAVEQAATEEEERAAAEKKAAEKAAEEGGDRLSAGMSREDLKLTEYQIFIQMGKDMGGINVEKLRGIADVVFGDNPDNLDRVWYNLSAMNIAIDLRKQWFMLWQNYLRGAGKPTEISSELQSELVPPAKRTPEQVKLAEAEGKDYDVIMDDNGLWKSTLSGGGLGEYTFAQANKEIIARNNALSKTQAGQQFPQEPASQLLSALAPYLTKESKQDSIASVLTALAPYLKDDAVNTKLEEMKVAITNAQGNKGGMSDQVVNMVKMLAALKEFGPVIRDMLGVQGAAPAGAQAAQTPIQLQNPDGSPMVMGLQDFFSIQKFQAEQKREDDSAKGKQEFMSTVRGFIGKIGDAAQKAAGQ